MSNTISRQAKLFVDRGLDNPEEAAARLKMLRMVIRLGADAAHNPAGQAAFMTAVSNATRCFIGGVYVTGALDALPITPLIRGANSLREAALQLHACEGEAPDAVELLIGNTSERRANSVRAQWIGWLATCQPSADAPNALGVNPLTAMAAAALCVSNAFRFAIGDQRALMKTDRLSLWQPGQQTDTGPRLERFLDKVWLGGLGNLGQAFLWTLSGLPFASPEAFEPVLQDFDHVTEDNWGTSVLVQRDAYGDLKGAVAEQWLRARGVRSRRVDRAIDEHLRRHDHEPHVALVGLDKVEPRKWMGSAGFKHIVDVGLGGTHATFTAIRITTFDETFTPAQHFGDYKRPKIDLRTVQDLKGYQHILKKEGTCGIENYAGLNIAYTFVSALAACLALAQCVRIAMGLAAFRSITLDSADLRTIQVVEGAPPARIAVGGISLK